MSQALTGSSPHALAPSDVGRMTKEGTQPVSPDSVAPPAHHNCNTCFFTDAFPGVTVEADQRCSVCHQSRITEEFHAHLTSNLVELQRLAAEWRAQRKGRYDCIIGGSGGLDSSYVLYIAKQLLGLNPLVVKYDHGFNHEAADRNLRTLCESLGVDLEVERSRGQHDGRYVKHMALALRHTGLYWPVCGFCAHAIHSVIYRKALRNGLTIVLGSANIFEGKLHMKRSRKIELLKQALWRTHLTRWPGMLWHFTLAAWHLLCLRLELHVPPLSNFFARSPHVPAMRHVTVSRFVPWNVPEMVLALEKLGWRAPHPALPMRFDCIIEDSLLNTTWKQTSGLTVQGVIACNLVHAGVRTREELAETVAGYDAGIVAATREVEKRMADL